MLRSSRSTRNNAHAAVVPTAAPTAAPEADKENAPAAVAAKPASALSLLGPKRTLTAKSTLLAGGAGAKAGLLKTNNKNAAAAPASDAAEPVKPAATPLRVNVQEASAEPAPTPASTSSSSSLLRKPSALLSSPLASPASSSTPLKLRPTGASTALARPQLLSTAQPSPVAAIREPTESLRAQAVAEVPALAAAAAHSESEAPAVAPSVAVASITLQPIAPAAAPAPAPAPAATLAAAITDAVIPALSQALAGLSCSEPAAAAIASLPPVSSSPAVCSTLATESALHITTASSSTDAVDPHCFMVAGRSYRKLTLLGKGGCGEVWRVLDAESGRTRALKRMIIPAPLPADAEGKLPASQKIVADYANEIKILQRFSDGGAAEEGSEDEPSAGRVLRLIAHEIQLQSDGSKLVSLVLEEGGSCLHSVLTSLAKSSGNLTRALDGASVGSSSSVRRDLFRSLCQCVAKVHRKGVAHLDLKPANFVQLAQTQGSSSSESSSSGNSSFPTKFALIDFGIARIVEDKENAATTGAQQVPQGSFNYMAPESLSLSNPAGPGRPADIWALGVLLFSLVYSTRSILTPFAHFKSGSEEQEARKISVIAHSSSDPPPAPTAAAAAVPAGASYSATNPYHIAFGSTKHTEALLLIRWCMRNNPEERPTIEQVMAHPFVTGEAAVTCAAVTDAGVAAPASAMPASVAATSSSAAASTTVDSTASSVASQAPSYSASYIVTGAQLHSLLSSLADRSLTAAQLLELERSFLQQLKPAL